MFFCGACRQEIELQEEIARPGHACKSLLHERPKHLHSATMCSAVHQPFEDGDDTSCGPACIVAFDAKIQADYDESLAWLEVDEEPPEPPAPMPIRRREGEPDAETEEPQATADTVFESVLVKPRVAVGSQRGQFSDLAICSCVYGLGMSFYLYKYPFYQICKSLTLYWDNPVRVGFNPPMSLFGLLLNELLSVLFGAKPGEL